MSTKTFGKGKARPQPPEKPGKSGAKRFLLLFFLTFLIVASLSVLAGLYAWNRYLPAKFAAPGQNDRQMIVMVSPGSGAHRIAEQLAEAGILTQPFWFKLKARLAGKGATLKAGEYSIQPHASIDQIFKQMRSGKVVQHSITFAEGLTVRAMLQILHDSPYLRGSIDEVPPEGSLMPQTYHVVRGTQRMEVLSRMRAGQEKLLVKLWNGRDEGLPLDSPEAALVLASIVEKETGKASERDKVAAVFLNRLRKGMRLESDPTILYGLNGGKPLGRGLRRSEIDKKSAWNTYQINGLPPTPICNPGRDALHAVLHPAKTRDLYFVADGNGGHSFAKTYAGHLANVAKWRQVERKRKQAAKAKDQ